MNVSVMSTKGILGHPTGSAGAVSLVVGLEGMARQAVIHTGGTSQPDPEIQFDLVLNEPRKRAIEWLQVNAFGFGGQNASLVVSAKCGSWYHRVTEWPVTDFRAIAGSAGLQGQFTPARHSLQNAQRITRKGL